MPEPAEAVKLARPALRWRIDLEGGFGVDLGEFPGEAEMPVVKLGGEAWVCGPELLRGKQQLLGPGARIAEARHAREHEAAKRTRSAQTRRFHAGAALVGLRISRHAAVSPSCCPAVLADARPPRAC